MRIVTALSLAAGALGLLAATLPANAAGTTRIETRPFYGAVVTIEEGVRVFRPLPPTERVIINPHGKTPLSLGFNETYEHNYNYNYNHESSESSDDDSGGYVGGYYGGYGLGHRGGMRGRRGHGGGGVPAFRGGHRGGGKHH